MASGFDLEFSCTGCEAFVSFPLRISSKLPWTYTCPHCGKVFGIDSNVARQLKLFVDLSKQLEASKEILSNSSVAVTVGHTEVKLPFKILLTRLRTTFEFYVEGQKIAVSSRVEPAKIAEALTRESLESTL